MNQRDIVVFLEIQVDYKTLAFFFFFFSFGFKPRKCNISHKSQVAGQSESPCGRGVYELDSDG